MSTRRFGRPKQACAALAVALVVIPLLAGVAWLISSKPLAAEAAPADKLAVGAACDLTPQLKEANQRWPAVAAGKDVYLVVWQDGEAMAGVKDTNIFAARVSADGKPLDPAAIPVCTAEGYQIYPAVGFDGTNFIVAWQDYRSGKDWDLYAARVSPEGKVLDTEGIVVAAVPGNQIYPTLASSGKQCLLVWSDLRPQQGIPEAYGLYGAFLHEGKPDTPGGRELVAAYNEKSKQVRAYLTPQVVYDGTSFVVAAQHAPSEWDYAGPSLFRVSSDGKTEPVNGGFLGESFALAGDPAGKRFLTWSFKQFEHGHSNCGYLSSLFSPGSEQVNHMAIGLQGGFGPRNCLWCAVTHNGKHFLAVIEQVTNPGYANDPRNIHGSLNVDLVATRIDPESGALLDTGSFPVDVNAWKDLRPSRQKALKSTASGPAGVHVAAEPDVQERHPAIASLGGGKALVVYSRRGGVGKFKIYGVVLD